MATLPVIQPSFAAGELSPFLYGRVDLAKFHVGARTMLNFFVHPHGGASNRPGTRYVGNVDDHDVRHRLVPFRFRSSPAGQNYGLVFGDMTMQVVKDGGFVESSPGVIYTLATPWAAADLPLLKFVQSADTMTITHPGYAPRQLTRTGHANWTLSTITFAPSVDAPTNLAASAAGTAAYIEVTTIADTGEESLPTASVGSSSASAGTWTWDAMPNAVAYNVYKKKGSIHGFVAQVTDATWTDDTIAPNIGNTPPGSRNPFSGAGEWPGCSTYYAQRQAFGGSTNKPQHLWFSVTGAFNNMNVSQPTRDDDAITRALVSREVNQVRHLVPVGKSMLVMSSGAEWRCYPGPSANALTPGSCVTEVQSSFGCSDVPPILAGSSLLFVQERGSRVRALEFELLQDQFQAKDMSILSQHLLFDTGAQYAIEEWAFAEEPFRIVWAVRSDGVLLGFTFMREHEVFAWHRHTTDGVVESVCSVPEATAGGALLDATYLIVRRTVGGETRRYVERLQERTFATVADAWFVDCGLMYDGAPVDEVTGLDHLEGKTVAILGDGSVVPSQVVSGGAVSLDGAYSKVIVGLPYTADLETLNLELPVGGTSQGRMKKIPLVTLRVKDSRGARVGLNQTVLQEVKQRQSEALGSPMQPYSGDWRVTIPSEWNTDGRLFVRQGYPLPVTVLDLIPDVAPGK